MIIQWARTLLASGPNRIALSSALRGVIATVTPLIALPLLGFEAVSRLAVIGALNTSNVDMGGSYRSRLASMLALAILGPLLSFAAMKSGAHWWLAAPAIFVIAFAGGMVRALGPGAASLGLNLCIAFLIGIQVGETAPDDQEASLALAYFVGASWTVLVALVFWQLRPYRRLEQEIAGAWQAVADQVAAVRESVAGTSVVSRRRRETDLARHHRETRQAVEQARAALGEMRSAMQGSGTTLARLLVLMRGAARIDAAMITFSETDAKDDTGEALRLLEAACHDMARLILAGRGDIDFEPFRSAVAKLVGNGKEGAAEARTLALAQALRHLDNAEDAAENLFGLAPRRRGPGIGVLRGLRPSVAWEAVRLQLTPRSALFRHALRVAVVAAVATGVALWMEFPHGIWLPLSALVVLQPDYGGTLSRAVQRSAGTAGGAVLAGLLLETLEGTLAFEVAIGLLLAGTFLVRRRHFGFAAMFMTPLIILLLNMQSENPWIDLVGRLGYTLAGGALAIGAGYVLWPLWERRRISIQIAKSLDATRTYLEAVLDAFTRREQPSQALADLRREAEVEAVNLHAAFERLMAEPRHRRGRTARAFAFDTYMDRLTRHTVAVAAHVGELALPADQVRALTTALSDALKNVADSVRSGRAPAPRPDFDVPLKRLCETLTTTGGLLMGRIVSDVTSLIAAAETR
jgi:uncharacterized membrane protein YccC